MFVKQEKRNTKQCSIQKYLSPAIIVCILILHYLQLRTLFQRPYKYNKEDNLTTQSNDGIPIEPIPSTRTLEKNVTYSEVKRVIYYSPPMKQFYNKTEDEIEKDANFTVGWENLVFIMLTYNHPAANSLIQAQFDTFIKRAGKGLDVVIVTDIDDPRTDEEIVPRNRNTLVNTHIYRSATPHEGRKGRSKVLDAFFHVQKKYKSNPNKLYIMKADPDAYVLPTKLLTFLQKLYERTYPQPVDFGRSNCNNNFTCYSQGGLYGWDREGFDRTFNYMFNHEPYIYNETLENFFNPGRNILENEDVFTSYVFRRATGYPVIWNRGVGANLTEVIDNLDPGLLSIHPVKLIDDFLLLDKILYINDEKYDTTKMKGIGKARKQMKNSSNLFSKLIWDEDTMEFRPV